MIGFEKVVSGSFKNKRDARKDLVYKLLKNIWEDMEKKLQAMRAQGVEYDEVQVIAPQAPPQIQVVTHNRKETQLSSSSRKVFEHLGHLQPFWRSFSKTRSKLKPL